MLATKAPWLLALCGENTSRVIFCQFSSVGNQTELPHVTVIGLNHPHMPPHPTHYKQLLLALTLKILRPLPKSLLALHWALMSEVTLTDTTLWVLCSSDLLTTSYHSCTDTHSWSGYCLHVWSEKFKGGGKKTSSITLVKISDLTNSTAFARKWRVQEPILK